MPAALARKSPAEASAPSPAPIRDAAALQALAREAARELGSEAADPDADRRGPFRPGVLLSARKRRARWMALRLVRTADRAALMFCAAVVTVLTLASADGSIRFAAALPLAAAAFASGRMLRVFEAYRFPSGQGFPEQLLRVVAAFAAALLPAALLSAVVADGALALRAAAVWSVAACAVTAGLHAWAWASVRRWRASGEFAPNVVVVGATRCAERLIRSALERRDLNVVGVFDDRLARAPRAVAGVPVLGDTSALLDHRIMPCVDRVVVAVDPSARTRVREIVQRLRVLPNEVALLVDLETESDRDTALTRLAEAPLARLTGQADDDERALAKRVQDLVIGSVAAVLLAPVLAVVALAVKLDSPGPVFFRQRRHGFNNETIVVWKFRTMRQEAADATASRQVTADDDRVTRLGRFLRKTSLDELPQLLNVLKGEMSLVGPRPHAVGMKTGEAESAQLVAEYAWRHRMKPGMTGWAAVNGSRGPLHTAADVRRRVALDVEYVERQSFWLDLWIMALTLPCLLGDREAIR
jgi:Undecaprenyl-phosphate glucose phosphotransferase